MPFADYGKLPALGGGSAAPLASRPRPGGAAGAADGVPDPGRGGVPGQGARPRAGGPGQAGRGLRPGLLVLRHPVVPGRFRSRRPTEILDEVAWLAGQGVSEVCLVAENSTSYGKDLGGREALVHLLRDLAGIDGLRRVRLNYLQPDELTAGLLEEMAANPVVCSYFDLSLQHASAPVLRRMRRGGSAGAFLDLVGRIRALDPDAAFRSNFILGFPGERQADVRELEAFLEAARLDWVAFFAWSPEDGTAALDLDGRVPATARARVERVQELQDRLLAEAQQAWVGRRLEVLVERVDDDGAAEGRSFREAPTATAWSGSRARPGRRGGGVPAGGGHRRRGPRASGPAGG